MKLICIFMIILTLFNLSACTKHEYSVYYPSTPETPSIYEDINFMYLDSNYTSVENKTDIMCIFFKDIEDMVIFSEKENDNEYLVSVILKNNTSVLMRYKNKKIFPETISFYKNSTIIKGLVKMDLVKYNNIDVTFYMNDTMELISGIELKNDIKNYKENFNLDKDENYNLNIMMNSLFILNSINNHITNNGQFQASAGFGPIFQALGTIVTGIAEGIMAAVGILVGLSIVTAIIVVPLISLITDSAKKALESKKVDEQFVINYRNSSAVILKDNQDIVFDGDLFIVNNVLNLVIPIKSDLAPIRWYIKHKPDSMSYAQIGQYFLFKNYNDNPISIKPDGLIVNLLVSGGMSEATFYIKNEKIQNLPDGESIIICFEFPKYSIVNGYYTDN